MSDITEGEANSYPKVRVEYTNINVVETVQDSGVTVVDAARMLSVSESTVRSWVSRGVLQAIKNSRPVRISAISLGETCHIVNQLRQLTDGGRLLPSVLEQLEDLRLRQELDKPLAQMRTGEAAPAPQDDLSLLFDS